MEYLNDGVHLIRVGGQGMLPSKALEIKYFLLAISHAEGGGYSVFLEGIERIKKSGQRQLLS